MDTPTPTTAPARLTWGTATTTLSWPGHPDAPPPVVLPLGVQSLAAACFSPPRPHPVELERAIDLVENALDGLGPLRSTHSALITTDAALQALAQAHGHPGAAGTWTLSREQVETLFQRLASASLGHPTAAAGLPDDSEAYARLLILRELMHHLHFDAVQLALPRD